MSFILFILGCFGAMFLFHFLLKLIANCIGGPKVVVTIACIGLAIGVLYLMGVTPNEYDTCRFNIWNVVAGVYGFIGICLVGCWLAIIKNMAQGNETREYRVFFSYFTVIYIFGSTIVPYPYDPDIPEDKEWAWKDVKESPYGEMYYDVKQIGHPKPDVPPVHVTPETLAKVIKAFNEADARSQQLLLDEDNFLGGTGDEHLTWDKLTENQKNQWLQTLVGHNLISEIP